MAAVKATPTSSRRPGDPSRPVEASEPVEPADVPRRGRPPRPSEQPLWLQVTSFVLAVLGLAISAYETYAHFNGNHLAGCSTGGGTFNCTAVITSSQSMVFGVIPVAILGLAFYVAAVPLFSPWAWRLEVARGAPAAPRVRGRGHGLRDVPDLRRAVQIGSICEYCTGVHIVTFLLFCITVFSAAIWGLGGRREVSGRRA